MKLRIEFFEPFVFWILLAAGSWALLLFDWAVALVYLLFGTDFSLNSFAVYRVFGLPAYLYSREHYLTIYIVCIIVFFSAAFLFKRRRFWLMSFFFLIFGFMQNLGRDFLTGSTWSERLDEQLSPNGKANDTRTIAFATFWHSASDRMTNSLKLFSLLVFPTSYLVGVDEGLNGRRHADERIN